MQPQILLLLATIIILISPYLLLSSYVKKNRDSQISERQKNRYSYEFSDEFEIDD